jgi:hypothetical protein
MSSLFFDHFNLPLNKKIIYIFPNFFREPTNYWQDSPDKKLQVKFVSVLETSATPLDLFNSIWFWHFCAHFWHFLDMLIRSGKYVVLAICNYLCMYLLTSQWQILKFYLLMANSSWYLLTCQWKIMKFYLCDVRCRPSMML